MIGKNEENKIMSGEKRTFQAEVARLLDIVAHSLYSDKKIFLRELISNASDACDKLRYEAITEPKLIEKDPEFKITLSIDKDKKTLTISDNGIGMSHDDLINNLGTIARSGTSEFLANVKDEKTKDVNLIGQFGVGFYSAFIVSDDVVVDSLKAGEKDAWQWRSDGKGEFTLSESKKKTRGTDIKIHLKEDSHEFLEDYTLRDIVKTYSDHIGLPIIFKGEKEDETLNAASALWTRNKSNIKPEQYKEFYHHVSHAFDEPWMTMHNKVEGVIEYTNLLFIPSTKPIDLFRPERETLVKLYVKRVFISDKCEGLLPPYLRFVRGIVDSQDLPLNVSREMLQNNPVLAKIKNGLMKRVFSELEKKAKNDPEGYKTFWDNFGAVLKEGLYEDITQKEKLLKLVRFYTSKSGDKIISLEEYVKNMKPGQEAVYTIAGEDRQQLLKSPQLEGFKSKDIEVLLLTDPVDEFWTSMVGDFEGKKFLSVTKGSADLDKIEDEEEGNKDKKDAKDQKVSSETNELVASFKITLKDLVKDVRPSNRLTESAVCLVADENDMDMHMEKILQQHQQLQETSKRILEINPAHTLIKQLAKSSKNKADLEEAAYLLLDQARILEGEKLPDPVEFSKRLAHVMEKSLKAA